MKDYEENKMDVPVVDDLELFSLLQSCAHRLRPMNRFKGQGRILIFLMMYGPLSQRRLSELIERKPATLSEQLDNMEKSGLIVRKRNEQDKRNVDVALTEDGLSAAKEAYQLRAAHIKAFFDVLSWEQKQTLYDNLKALWEIWKDIPSPDKE